MTKLLILGGTSEASALARALKDDPRFAATLSLAGRTAAPVLPSIPVRIGGFGGVTGLARYLREQRIDGLLDATHPFAARITQNAVAAAREAGTPLLLLRRPEWKPVAGDRWIAVADMHAAARALGETPRRVLLTIGQQDLAPFRTAPWHHYVIRSVDPPPPDVRPPVAEIITARGPFMEAAERRLLEDLRIELLVTKNSGGSATYAKLSAARALGLPVVIVARPPAPQAESVVDIAAALHWLSALHDTLAARRGA
jgi:precorrin-6A/cobalt-precorrin-6A reductase